MTLSVGAGVEVLQVGTMVSDPNTGLSAEQLADLCTNKIVHVGSNVPEPLRQQGLAYKEQVRGTVQYYMVQAQRSERTTVLGILEQAGMTEAAEILRRS